MPEKSVPIVSVPLLLNWSFENSSDLPQSET